MGNNSTYEKILHCSINTIIKYNKNLLTIKYFRIAICYIEHLRKVLRKTDSNEYDYDERTPLPQSVIQPSLVAWQSIDGKPSFSRYIVQNLVNHNELNEKVQY